MVVLVISLEVKLQAQAPNIQILSRAKGFVMVNDLWSGLLDLEESLTCRHVFLVISPLLRNFYACQEYSESHYLRPHLVMSPKTVSLCPLYLTSYPKVSNLPANFMDMIFLSWPRLQT